MVTASFSNSGQICLCCSRIFVHESLFDRFVSAMVDKTKQMVQGDPLSPDVRQGRVSVFLLAELFSAKTRIGALISKEHLAKVSSYVELAKQEGGTIVCGGAPPANLPERVAVSRFDWRGVCLF